MSIGNSNSDSQTNSRIHHLIYFKFWILGNNNTDETLESALIPIPSEIIMPFSGFLALNGRLEPIMVRLAGSFGNLVGSIATYYLGIKAGRAFIVRYSRYIFFRKHHLELTEQLFQEYGDKIAFVGRLLPRIRTYVSFPVGIGKTRFIKFAVYNRIYNLEFITYIS